MKELIFIRHPEAVWNTQKRYLGHSDIGLTKKGEEQANLINDYLKNKEILAVYSSDLIRAKKTAALIAKTHSLAVKADKRLREANFGEWEGLTFEQIKEKYPKLAEQYLSNPDSIKFPKGESLLEFESRVDEALEEILEKADGTVVVVSHAGVNRIIICSLLGLSLSQFWQIKQGRGAINIIEVHGKMNVVSLINYAIS